MKLFIAMQNNKIVATGAYDKKFINAVYVKYNLIGKGIGTKIIKRIISEAKKNGLKTIRCQSSLFAEKTYAKLGFKKIRKITQPYSGSTVTYILMEKQLK